MLKAVKGFEASCASDKHGLCVIALPTGVGKTYQIIDHIAHQILEGGNRLTIFITPLVKNLNSARTDILERLFQIKGLSFSRNDNSPYDVTDPSAKSLNDLFQEKVVFLRSYEEQFKSVFDNKMIKAISASGFDPQNLDQLSRIVERIKKIEGSCSDKEELGLWREEFEDKESKFRKELRKWVGQTKKKGQSTKEFLAIHSWIADLYPSVKASSCDILLMTVDKFLAFDDPIFSKKRPLFQQDYVKGSLIFIDEFDTTKEWILRKQIDEASNTVVDLMQSHFLIQSRLSGHYPYPPFDKDDTTPNSPKVIIPLLREYFEKESKQYHLDYTIKTDDDSLKNGLYLFDDGYDIKLVTKENGFVSFELDHENRNQLRLKFSPQSIEGAQDFIPTVLSLARCRRHFISEAVKMCRYYYEKRSAGEHTYEASNAVSTIMDPFYDERLSECVLREYMLPVRKKTIPDQSGPFYYSGFRYFYFEDKDDAELTTSLNMVEFGETPEKFLVSLCKRAMVVGLSATADIDTVTGNYDTDFLREQLQGWFYELKQAEKDELAQLTKERIGENNPGAKVVPIESPTDESAMPSAVFTNPSNQEELDLLLFNSGALDYKKQRFVRFLIAIKEFVASNGHAMLLMSNDNPSENNPLYTQPNIERMLTLLAEENGHAEDKPKVFTYAGSQYECEKTLEQYFSCVPKNRVILLSSYQSSGTGQNLQYPIELADFRKAKRDIDTIYLEYPTNITVDLSKAFSPELTTKEKDKNLIKYLYQAKAVSQRNEFSLRAFQELARNVFQKRINPKAPINGKLNKTISANNHRVKVLIQAVGRICRVPNEDQSDGHLQKRILVDSRILDMDFSCASGHLLNPEFASLIAKAKAVEMAEEDPAIIVAENNCVYLSAWIKSVLGRFDEETKLTWRAIRSYALAHPTINKTDLDPAFEILYMENKASRYFTNGDEYEPSISWKKDKAHSVEISEKTSRLSELMQIEELRVFFEKQSFATAFGNGDLILNPVAFQSIYLGALGESCGRALLESDGIALDEIENCDHFEVFDYALHDNHSVFIDFKHWSPGTSANVLHNSKEFRQKLSKVQGSSAYVVNLLAEGYEPHSEGPVHFFPSLLRKNGRRIEKDAKEIILLESMLGKEK